LNYIFETKPAQAKPQKGNLFFINPDSEFAGGNPSPSGRDCLVRVGRRASAYCSG